MLFPIFRPILPIITVRPRNLPPNPRRHDSNKKVEEPKQISESEMIQKELSQMKRKGYIPAWSELGVRWIKPKKE